MESGANLFLWQLAAKELMATRLNKAGELMQYGTGTLRGGNLFRLRGVPEVAMLMVFLSMCLPSLVPASANRASKPEPTAAANDEVVQAPGEFAAREFTLLGSCEGS